MKKLTLIFCTCILFLYPQTNAQRQMENLDRGTVAVRANSSQVFISWRILGTEFSGVTFNLYRGSSLIASNLNVSNYTDNVSSNSTYSVAAVVGGVEQARSAEVNVWGNNYLDVPLQRPATYTLPDGGIAEHTPNDCSVADLNGDGNYEIIVKWEARFLDNSFSGYSGNVIIDAYTLSGTRLWRLDLGINIRGGAHYNPFLVYDFDGDGKAELAVKTAPGTRSGTGAYLSMGPAASDNDAADYRNSAGYVLDGPEYLTVFNGQTGAEMATVNYVPQRGDVCGWGDCYGNRVDRFLACVAYLDGVTPSLVMCRGYYGRSVLAAWDFENGSLTQRWVFDSGSDPNLEQYNGQGAHSISVGDADNDGRDEIMYGAMAIDDDGSPMYNTNFLHGDATHFGDLIPSAPGLEFYMPSETAGWTHEYWGAPELGTVTNPGVHVRNGGTGSVIFRKEASGDIGRAMTADISAAHPGNEFWATGGLGVYNSSGQVISSSFPPVNFASWWDGDLLREMLDGTTISKWGAGNLLSASGCASNNGTKATPNLSADILGDWREEVIFRTTDNTRLRIFTTTNPTSQKIYTLMHDPVYRLAIAWQNVGYNQPPHTGFFLGNGMATPPIPNIILIGGSTCTPTAITPYVQVNGGTWNQTSSASVSVGDQVSFGPQPISGGSWNWSGPNGFSASTREVTISNIQTNQAGNYVATYTNSCGAQSNATFSVSVSGGPTGTTITIQENQTGFCGVDGTVDNNNSGFTGDGFANTSNATGNGVDYKVTFSSSGTYTFTFGYASTSDRPGRLIINGSTVVSSISFPSTASWTTWSTVSATASVSAGTFDVRIEATGTSGLGNIDYMQVTGTTPSAASCSSTPDTYTLTTNVNGQGSISPSGGTYEAGTVIALTATPASGWQFDNWSGALSGNTNPANLTINSNVTVTANFSEVSQNPITIVIQENQTGFCSVDGTIDNNNSGFTGDGFANTSNAIDNGITWSVDVPSSGSYALTWRYANGGSTDRTAQLMVDGSTVVSNISFSGTGSWTTWVETSGTNVSLSTGTKLIRLQATNSSGLSNIDYISITGINPAPVSCTGLKSGDASAELTSISNSFEFNLNPNPVNRALNIEFNEELAEGATIQLFDNTGRMILNSKVKGFEHTLDMSNMDPGIYLLKVSNNYQSINKRVIKN